MICILLRAMSSFYGLLTTVLPLFRLFRLPFKLLVFTSLALSTLAGIGWDRMITNGNRRGVIVITTVLIIPTALLLAVSTSLRRPLAEKMAASPEGINVVFGPRDAAGAVTDLQWGLGHGLAALPLDPDRDSMGGAGPRPGRESLRFEPGG